MRGHMIHRKARLGRRHAARGFIASIDAGLFAQAHQPRVGNHLRESNLPADLLKVFVLRIRQGVGEVNPI